jgi:hypothetical protein
MDRASQGRLHWSLVHGARTGGWGLEEEEEEEEARGIRIKRVVDPRLHCQAAARKRRPCRGSPQGPR